MVDVFISYSRTDQAAVAKLAQAVEREGYVVWWDAELPVHQSYSDVITDKIGRAKAAIVVWSPEAVKSEWVRAEADVGRNQKKLIQTCIGQVMPPLPFNQIQFAEIGDWHGEADHPGWCKVKRSLADLVRHEEDRPDPAHWPQAAVAAPLPPPQARTTGSARWPLYAGLGVAGAGLLAAGAFILGARDGEEIALAGERAAAASSRPNDEPPELAKTKAELARMQEQLAARDVAATGPAAPSGRANQPAMALMTYRTGFDCARASTNVERMICTNADLAALDRKLSGAYDAALADAANPSQRIVLRATQRQFLRGRNACRTVECLGQAYEDRLHDLAIGVQDEDA